MSKINIEDLTIKEIRELKEKIDALCATGDTPKKGRPVVVTTKHAGVFFGYTEDVGTEENITLYNARNAFYWKCTGGIMELPASGPKAGSKVGDTAPKAVIRNVTKVSDCTPEAEAAWLAATWG